MSKKLITVSLHNKHIFPTFVSDIPRVGDTLCFKEPWVVVNVVRIYDDPQDNGIWYEHEVVVECVLK